MKIFIAHADGFKDEACTSRFCSRCGGRTGARAHNARESGILGVYALH